MDVIGAPSVYRAAMNLARSRGAAVGFVPTMGALHGGHLSLLRRARVETDHLAMSIFVNPLQFGASEDLTAYPRALERDLEIATDVGCDTVFTPTVEEMYPDGAPSVTIDPGALGERLEGAARPGHFRGVLTVVSKLFHLTGPCSAFFGEKDAQQLALIGRMVDHLNMPIELMSCPTVRDPDGVALSSRNARLAPWERDEARCLWQALQEAILLASAGERSRTVLADVMRERIDAAPLARLTYATVVDDETWEEPERLDGPARAVVAARFGSTRMIDNALLPGGEASGDSPNGKGSRDAAPDAR